MDDVTVDLGPLPMEHAETLLLCVRNCLNNGNLWERENQLRATSLNAWLTYRIAKAEKTATFSEPG